MFIEKIKKVVFILGVYGLFVLALYNISDTVERYNAKYRNEVTINK